RRARRPAASPTTSTRSDASHDPIATGGGRSSSPPRFLVVLAGLLAGLHRPHRLWVGSANQRFHYVTTRYGPEIETPVAGAPCRTLEVRIGADGRWSANGWPALAYGTGRTTAGPS